MLYKVTPMLSAPEETKKAKGTVPAEGRQARKRRKSAIYDFEGNEVLITLMCLKCRQIKPLAQFGLRKMADGAIRNQPWCRTCRSGAGTKKPKTAPEQRAPVVATEEATPVPSGDEVTPAVPAVVELLDQAPTEPAAS